MTAMLVVVVNYRTGPLVIDCLRSLVGEVAQVPDLRVVVVDNASGDGSVERIERTIADAGWTWASVVASAANLGFGAGNNLAIRQSLSCGDAPDLFWLLNPDTRVEPGAAAALIRFAASTPRAGVIGTRLLLEDGSAWPYAFRFPTILSEVERGARLSIISRLLRGHAVARRMGEIAEQVDWVSGASCVLRRDLVEEIGLFDENFFLYYEETDLMLRARRAGWQCWYAPEATVLHLAGQSTKVTGSAATARRIPGYWFQSRQRYFRKSHGLVYAAVADFAWAAAHLVWCTGNWMRRSTSLEPPRLLADFLRHSMVVRAFARPTRDI